MPIDRHYIATYVVIVLHGTTRGSLRGTTRNTSRETTRGSLRGTTHSSSCETTRDSSRGTTRDSLRGTTRDSSSVTTRGTTPMHMSPVTTPPSGKTPMPRGKYKTRGKCHSGRRGGRCGRRHG